MKKFYRLLDSNGISYLSEIPGTFGGHRKTKIYGRLDCRAALRALASGTYKRHRVFFANEAAAISAGYRPCYVCMRAAYDLWKSRTASD
ncbi:metal-binding protein [Pseudomonas oryzihabitans]|nr:Ada metal-binding domain-containing protein [Pseudomonas oryzihabitans]NMZ44246.1 metal-binding protein [Pseudomonas oryzihabitans]